MPKTKPTSKASHPEVSERLLALLAILDRLRAPDGCPWDREQTHASLREYLLEETYEVLESLDNGDSAKLQEELGDLLLQILLHSQIATESGDFAIGDVIKGINEKLIYRHPHIFGSVKAETAEEVMKNWQELKKEEKGEDQSMLSGVPRQMPSLSYSQAIQRRVAQAGFDWENIDGVIDKLAEEVAEFKEAGTNEEKAQEFGDVLFTLVNIARRLGVDSESALRESNKKFYDRFSCMEGLCRERGLTFADLSFEEQNKLWNEAKKMVSG